MADWRVRHRRHNGEIIHTYKPENLQFQYNLNEPHTISYELSLADDTLRADPNAATAWTYGDPIQAYVTDFELLRGGKVMMAGMHTLTSIKAGEESIKIGGQDWLHYLQRRTYPFDPNNADRYLFKALDSDIGQITKDILATVLSMDYSLEIDLSQIDTSTGTRENYRIDAADSEDILSKIQGLAQGQPGFDFGITHDKIFKIFSPQKGDPLVLWWSIGGNFDTPNSSPNWIDLEWIDNGPEATHVVGTNSTGGHSMGVAYSIQEAMRTYRRMDKFENFTDLPQKARLRRLTKESLSHSIHPQHEFPITIDALRVPNFWDKFQTGRYIYIAYSLEEHLVASEQRIVGIECTVSDEGEETVDLHLNQWRPTVESDIVESI